MAPEVLNRKNPDSKVDIWALGVILYEFLTCSHPFSVDNHLSIGAITNEDFTPLPSTVSSFMKGLLTKLLEKDPNKRPDTSALLSIEEIKA
jgi:serine/threonine protein kinase